MWYFFSNIYDVEMKFLSLTSGSFFKICRMELLEEQYDKKHRARMIAEGKVICNVLHILDVSLYFYSAWTLL